jgi:hypothetical protein
MAFLRVTAQRFLSSPAVRRVGFAERRIKQANARRDHYLETTLSIGCVGATHP